MISFIIIPLKIRIKDQQKEKLLSDKPSLYSHLVFYQEENSQNQGTKLDIKQGIITHQRSY